MQNQIEKINKEYNPLLFEMESKLDLLVKGQESNSNKLEVIGNGSQNVIRLILKSTIC